MLSSNPTAIVANSRTFGKIASGYKAIIGITQKTIQIDMALRRAVL